MAYPVMTLREFNDYMQEGHFKYSLFVILQLDVAAVCLQKAKKADQYSQKYWYQWAYVTLTDALETAESEHLGITSSHLPIEETDPVTRAYCRNTYNIWRGYLKKLNVDLPEEKF